MANYNPYLDFKVYDSSMYNMHEEKVPMNSSFCYRNGEKCFYQSVENPLPLPAVLQNVESGIISELDKKVLCLIGTFGYITTKQITECLILMHYDFNEKRLKSSLDRLRKNQMIHACKFGIDKESAAVFHTFSLNRTGNELVKNLGISTNYSMMNIATQTWDVKRTLEQNQVMLAYLKSGLPIDWMKRSTVINAKDDKNAVLRPSFAVSTDGEILLYEIVRSGDLWQFYMKDKLIRYKKLLDAWSDNSWHIENTPTIIMNGENAEQNKEIRAIAEEVGIDVLFTEDLLLCGEHFYQHIYNFTEQNALEFFAFEMNLPRVTE